jgi:tetratricopeptide (TPR) repeat protein
MRLIQTRRKLFLALVFSVSLATGCATTPRQQDPDLFGMLYDGESTAAYATAFPVGSPEEAYANAELAARGGDLDRALYEYIRGLRLEDEPAAEPLYRIGAIHHQRENHRLAEMAYRWALEADPDHGAAGTGLGLLQLARRQYDEAEAQLLSVSDQGNSTWHTHNALGILSDLHGHFDEAAGHYRRALDSSPENYVVLNNLGYSRYLAGDWGGARDALHGALRSNPNYPMAWRNLGLLHAREGNYDAALDALGRIGSEAEAYNDIGYVAMLEGRYTEAAFFFEEALRLSPTFYVTASENARHLERRIRRNAVIPPE